jgi:hypothetical protein
LVFLATADPPSVEVAVASLTCLTEEEFEVDRSTEEELEVDSLLTARSPCDSPPDHQRPRSSIQEARLSYSLSPRALTEPVERWSALAVTLAPPPLTLAPSRLAVTLAPPPLTLAPSRLAVTLAPRVLTLAPSRLALTLAPPPRTLAPSRLALTLAPPPRTLAPSRLALTLAPPPRTLAPSRPTLTLPAAPLELTEASRAIASLTSTKATVVNALTPTNARIRFMIGLLCKTVPGRARSGYTSRPLLVAWHRERVAIPNQPSTTAFANQKAIAALPAAL